MSSLRRVLSSRSNGALSTGPKTPEGKRRSSRNALRHGLLARCIVLSDESPEAFHTLVAEHLARFAPSGGVELGMVEEMAAALWRLRRAWAIETRLLDGATASQPAGDPLSRIAAAFSDLASSPQFALLNRYESRLHCMYQRALKNLLLLRAVVPERPPQAAPDPDAVRAPSPLPRRPGLRRKLPYRQWPARAGKSNLLRRPKEPSPKIGHSPLPPACQSRRESPGKDGRVLGPAPHAGAAPCGMSNTWL